MVSIVGVEQANFPPLLRRSPPCPYLRVFHGDARSPRDEAPKGARRQSGEPSRRSRRLALEGEVKTPLLRRSPPCPYLRVFHGGARSPRDEAPNGARRQSGEPSRRMPAPGA